MVPSCVVVGATGLEPAGSLMPPTVRAGSPPSNTVVSPASGGGTVMSPGDESATAMVSVAVDWEPSPSLIV